MNKDYIIYNGELYHWGVKGMKWGVRRFQNEDGTLTPEGQKRLADSWDDRVNKQYEADYRDKHSKVERLERKFQNEGKKIYETAITEEDRSKLKAKADELIDATMEYHRNPDNIHDDPDSKEYKELHEKAHNAVIDEYMKYDEDNNSEWLKDEMDFYEEFYTKEYKDFRDYYNDMYIEPKDYEETYQYYVNEYKGPYEKQWKQNHPDNQKKREAAMKKYQQVEKEYKEECAKITDKILGEYSRNRGLFKNRRHAANVMDYHLKLQANGARIKERYKQEYEDEVFKSDKKEFIRKRTNLK